MGFQLLSVLEEAGALLLGQARWMVALAILFTIAHLYFPQFTCNPGKAWWRGREFVTDISYVIVTSVVGPYLALGLQFVFALALWGGTSAAEIQNYVEHGGGILAHTPLWLQAVVYLVLGDFLLYWGHRIFHGNYLWPFHAVHHSATQVDWLTTFRTHPVNLVLDVQLVHLIMVLLGVSPKVMMWFVPFDILSATFVHANLNWTLGPLKYVVASPVFHRWHHGPLGDGGDKNFGATFAFWDLLFGTFYMPKGRLPEVYGLGDYRFPSDIAGQIVAPFGLAARDVWNDVKKLRPAASTTVANSATPPETV